MKLGKEITSRDRGGAEARIEGDTVRSKNK